MRERCRGAILPGVVVKRYGQRSTGVPSCAMILRNLRYLTALAREEHFARATRQTVGVVIPGREPARAVKAPDVAAALEERASATDV